MSGIRAKSSRRAFFLQGSAALGAGVATAVGTSAPAAQSPAPLEEQLKQLRQQLDSAQDREAIRQLHLAFTSGVESQSYDAVAELFDEQASLQLSGASATGKAAIAQLFAHQYREQNGTALHSAYRQSGLQQRDTVTLGGDRLHATATFHVEVELCTPLQADCTAATMARLQGHVVDRRWQTGRFEAQYVKRQGEWKMASLSWLAS